MRKVTTITTDDILITLCTSVTEVLSKATLNDIHYSAMVQKIHKTCLKPDLGCFVLFDGGFSGLVVINFTAAAALEIYSDYMKFMGIPEDELATAHTSDEVGNVMGELMNQIIGAFTVTVGRELQTKITQNQPKMLTINKQVQISINTNLDRPQARRVTLNTKKNNIFYLELAMDKTEFIKLHDFDTQDEVDPDELIQQASKNAQQVEAVAADNAGINNDLLDELGI